jgi:hypothetical protein
MYFSPGFAAQIEQLRFSRHNRFSRYDCVQRRKWLRAVCSRSRQTSGGRVKKSLNSGEFSYLQPPMPAAFQMPSTSASVLAGPERRRGQLVEARDVRSGLCGGAVQRNGAHICLASSREFVRLAAEQCRLLRRYGPVLPGARKKR